MTSKTSLVFSDIGKSDRREARLHFLADVPILDLSILYFVDASAPAAELPAALEDLAYHVAYAADRTKYVGVVLNKQDLLPEPESWAHIHSRRSGESERDTGDEDRDAAVRRISAAVNEVMEGVVGTGDAETVRWEVIDGGRMGFSAKLGTGVNEVYDVVARAVFEVERAGMGLLGMVTGGPTGLG